MRSTRTGTRSDIRSHAAQRRLDGASSIGGAPVLLEARGGFNVPTFDISDVVDAGPSVGLGPRYSSLRSFG